MARPFTIKLENTFGEMCSAYIITSSIIIEGSRAFNIGLFKPLIAHFLRTILSNTKSVLRVITRHTNVMKGMPFK